MRTSLQLLAPGTACVGYCSEFAWVWGSLVWTAHHSMRAGDRFRHRRHCHSTDTIRDPFATTTLTLKRSIKRRLKKVPPACHSCRFRNDPCRCPVGSRPLRKEAAAWAAVQPLVKVRPMEISCLLHLQAIQSFKVQPDTSGASALSMPYASLLALPPTPR